MRFLISYVFIQIVALSASIHADATALLSKYDEYLQRSKAYIAQAKTYSITFPVRKDANSHESFTRNGFLELRPDALGTIIVCHGYTQSKHEAFFFKAFFPHFNILAFDFRAHGELTQGQYSTIGKDEVYDVYGAVQYVKKHPELQGKPIIGFGFSMGAVSLFQAQAEYQNLFDLLVLDSPFDSSTDCMDRSLQNFFTYTIFGKQYHIPGKDLVMRALYKERLSPLVKPIFKWATGMNPHMVSTKFVPVIPLEKAKKITIPCFFISCEKDTKVTVDSVERLYEAVHSSFKRLWITRGIKHCGSCLAQPDLYAYKVNKFINKVFSKNWKIAAKIKDDRNFLK